MSEKAPTCRWCGAPCSGAATGACDHCGRPISSEASPSATADTAGPEPPNIAIAPSRLHCRCGYDLSGTPLGGTCPECGLPVAASIGPPEVRVAGRAIAAIVCASCAVPMLCGCPPVAAVLSSVGVLLGIRTLRDPAASSSTERTVAAIAISIGGLVFLVAAFFSTVFLVAMMTG